MKTLTSAAIPSKDQVGATSAVVFICFFVSGFCSLLYQVLWTRLAFAQFGIIAPVLSLTVSTFMLGLGLGSILGGLWVGPVSRRLRVSPLLLYAAAEAIVALGAFAVPRLLAWGGGLLLHAGTSSSTGFLFFSAIVIVLSLLPWCIAMGATFPLMMGFVRQMNAGRGESFGFLYAANVLGAASGAAVTAIALIELFGLRGTGMLGAAGNAGIAILALVTAAATGNTSMAVARRPEIFAARDEFWLKPALFITGFSCVGMEVCWARDFTLELRTSIYAFAAILTFYLLATCAGSSRYRQAKAASRIVPFEKLSIWLFPFSMLPLIATDPRLGPNGLMALISIVPLCWLLGYATPGLIDRFGNGDPKRTGRLYAINIAGGIFGPLVAGYLLLPALSIHVSIILLALPLAAAFFISARQNLLKAGCGLAALLGVMLLACRSYDEAAVYGKPVEVHRDYSAAVIASGTGMSKILSVNGVHITYLTTVTKIMADLPMALQGHPRAALDICFGMGTTFRTLTTWGIDTTAVDLSPAVIASFGFFHANAADILANPRDRAIADDGRRFLARTNRQFDVITIDPPPPVGAAGSSLLYSVQFYDLLKQRLAPGGVLAQWAPLTVPSTLQSIALALRVSFPYVRVFPDGGGTHFIAAMTPVPNISAAQFVSRMPTAAQADLVEWAPGETPEQIIAAVLAREEPIAAVLPPPGSNIPALSDNRPYNEYFILRMHTLFDDLMMSM
jgi:predicted membrane-bound spermidine synthase